MELRLVAALPCWVSFFQGKVCVGARSFTVDLKLELGLDPPRQAAAMDPDASGVSSRRTSGSGWDWERDVTILRRPKTG